MEDTNVTGWRKSTYSGGNGGQCVEVGDTARSAVAVRDTADRDGVTLSIQAGAWRTFIAACR